MQTLATPERSLAQRFEALERANEIRSARAQLKRDLKAGRRSVAGVLAAPPENLLTLKVEALLRATPKYGQAKVDRVLRTARVSPSKTLGGMTDRQRREVVNLLKPRPRVAPAPKVKPEPVQRHLDVLRVLAAMPDASSAWSISRRLPGKPDALSVGSRLALLRADGLVSFKRVNCTRLWSLTHAGRALSAVPVSGEETGNA